MKVTRVLLASNDNPNYYQFWNPISRVYKENFNIQPTLIWLGESSDIEKLGLSSDFGNIIIQKPDPTHHIGWQSAWSIFWHMKFYPDDTFITMGIDQVPLSNLYFDFIKNFDDDSYVMLADDGYLPDSSWQLGGTSPTSFHICKGSVASKVYGFEEEFHVELNKIAGSGIEAYYGKDTNWGLDESYSSHKLRDYCCVGGKVEGRRMFKYICDIRIECGRTNEVFYSREGLKNGTYGDAHLCRPFDDHKEYLETMFKLIPKINII